MSLDCWIGIDLGTSGCRICAIDRQGQILASLNTPYPDPLSQSEQDPLQLWQHVWQTLTKLVASLSSVRIQAISVDATSGSVMLASADNQPCSPILLYKDRRASEQVTLIDNIAPADSAARGSASGLSKLLWLQDQLPLSWPGTLLHQADWINVQLGAEPGITDTNNALKSGYDPVTQCWPDWLQQLAIRPFLPRVVQPGTEIGQLRAELVRELGLTTPPAIRAGTTDSTAAFIASGADKPGDAVTVLGSTLVLKLLANKPVFDARYGIYSHKLADCWLVGGASNSGGQVLQHFFTDAQLSSLSQQIDLAEQAADFYPLLSPGERFPLADPAFTPRLSPRPADDVQFLHGLLNSMAAIEKQGYQLLAELSQTNLRRIFTSGGGSHNQIWQTIRQQHFNVPVLRAPQTEAAFGAAILARDGLNHYQR